MLYLMQQKAGNPKSPFLGKDGKRYQIYKKEKVPKPYSCEGSETPIQTNQEGIEPPTRGSGNHCSIR